MVVCLPAFIWLSDQQGSFFRPKIIHGNVQRVNMMRRGVAAGRKDIKLVTVKVAGKELQSSEYELTDKKLTLSSLPAGEFEVEIEVDIKPQVSPLDVW